MVPGACAASMMLATPPIPVVPAAAAVPEEYVDAVSKLPALAPVRRAQRPALSGQPFEMQVGGIQDAPRNAGDPWRGAYSAHGFWFRLAAGDAAMFDKFVAFSQDQDAFLMRYELLEELKVLHANDVDFLVAANQRGDFIGGIVRGGGAIVAHFVREEYRHSGIGSILLKELIARSPAGRQLSITLNSPLFGSIRPFGSFAKEAGSAATHIIVTCPTGLGALSLGSYRTLTDLDWASAGSLLAAAGLSIDAARFIASEITVVGDEQGAPQALVRVSEAAGGYVKRIVVGPLVARSAAAAEAALRAALQPLFNDKTDYAWNPDVHSLQRRSLHFRVPAGNTVITGILGRLKGEGEMLMDKITYETFSTENSEALDLSKSSRLSTTEQAYALSIAY